MAILTAILNTLMVVLCLFLICLILIQRGKGGGLAGAFGGVGGSSAFGTKAGDIFTRVTVGVAAVWIVLSLILVALYNSGSDSAWGDDTGASALSRELTPKSTTPGSTTPGTTTPAPAGTTAPAPAAAPAGGPATAPATTPAPAAASPSPAPATTVPAIPDAPAAK